MLKYLQVIWEGADGKASIKRIMAMMSFISYLITCFAELHQMPELVLGSLQMMTLALLGITTYQTIKSTQQKSDTNDT